MKIRYDADSLYELISDFYKISGISISIVGKNRERVTNYTVKRQDFCNLMQKTHIHLCHRCDSEIIAQCEKTRKPALHTCHAGLFDAALPIIVEGEIVGYVTIGQVRRNESFSSVATKLPTELIDELEAHYYKLPIFDNAQMESAIRIVNAIITQIVKENMIEITTEELSILAAKYIDEHICEELSVEKLCHHLNISKNRLYQCMRQCFDLTVNGYITKRRIEKATELLNDPELSVKAIAKEVGFSETPYFYKVFKKETGKTPRSFKQKYH